MCDQCRCVRRCISCHEGKRACCPSYCCNGRSCSMDSRSCRCIFPGEFQKFSDMIPPSFLLKDPKSRKKKTKSKTCTTKKCEEENECKDQTDCGDHEHVDRSGRNGLNEEECLEALGCSEEPGVPAEPGVPEEPAVPGSGMPGGPGPGFCFQPTHIPYYGTYCPSEIRLMFGVPPQTQYGCFGFPGPMVSPMAQPARRPRRNAVIHNTGIPAAGLPTKYVPQFNPCTGQAAEGPTCNQFYQGVNMCFGPPSPYYLYNAENGSVVMAPADIGLVDQANPSAGQGLVPQANPSAGQVSQGDNKSMDQRQGKERRKEHVLQGPESRNRPVANQHLQYTPYNYGQGVMDPRQVSNQQLQYNPYNYGQGVMDPQQNPLAGQVFQGDNRSMYQRQGKKMRDENVLLGPESRNRPVANQHLQYNPYNYGQGVMDPRQVPNQHYQNNRYNFRERANSSAVNQGQAYKEFSQGLHMGLGPVRPNYLYNGGEGSSGQSPEEGPVPQANSSAVEVSQDDNRSQRQRKENENEKREGNVAKPTQSRKGNQNNPNNLVEVEKDPRQVSNRNPSQGGKRSKSQGNRTGSSEDPRSKDPNRYKPPNSRDEPRNHREVPPGNPSGQVAQRHQSAGPVSQRGKRSKSQGNRKESRKDPRPNQHNQYNPPNFREEPLDSRKVAFANPPGNQVSQGEKRSKPPENRHESRRENSARKPRPSGNKQCQTAPNSENDFVEGTRNLDQAHNGHNMIPWSSIVRNKSRESPPRAEHESNVHFYPQSVDMSFGPSNQFYVSDYLQPDPIYVSQLESTVGESHPEGNGRSILPKERHELKETRREHKSGNEGPPRNQPLGEATPNQPIRKCCLQFDPNNQYYQYYASDHLVHPSTPENLRSAPQESSRNDCSELLNRISESCSSRDLQKWSDRLALPMDKSKKKSAPAAKKAKKSSSKSSSPKSSTSKGSPNSMMKRGGEESTESSTTSTKQGVESQESSDSQKKSGSEEACVCGGAYSCCCSTQSEKSDEEKSDEDKEKSDEDKKDTTSDPESANKKADAAAAGCCTNGCWIPRPSGWPCCYTPCNGCYRYCSGCCNGCRTCCTYCCQPCGRYCCSRPSPNAQYDKIPPKPKDKQDKKGLKRYPGGTVGGNPGGYCSLRPRPRPLLSCPNPRPSTMPGYFPTERPQFNSPYSGHWQARGVVSHPRSLHQRSAMNICCMRH